MAGQTLGVIDFTWRNRTIDAEKGSTIKLGGYKLVPVIVNGKTFYCREYETSEVELTFPLPRGMDPNEVWGTGSGELQCNCDTGQSFTFPEAFPTNRPNMTGGEGGKMKMTLSAGPAETLLNG